MKLLLLTTLLCSGWSFGQNLIVNPGAESDPSTDWTLVATGSSCYTGSNWHITGNQNGFPAAHTGNNFFYSGCNFVEGIIYQDVDVSAFATSIDAGASTFSFEGYMQVYPQTPPDNSRIIVEYRDAGGVVLSQYDTGQQANQNIWTQYSDMRVAPVGTRTIRIQLMSYSFNGDSVDAYFDNLSLTHLSVLPVILIFFDAVANDQREVQISWATASEQKSSHFRIDKSTDFENWDLVTEMDAAGESEQMTYYNAIDTESLSGVSYYRLCQIDLDGTETYYQEKSVSLSVDKVLIVPNPAVEGFVLVQNAVSITSVFGVNGTKIPYETQATDGGNILMLSNVEPGCYYVRAKMFDGTQVTSKLMVK